MHKRARQGRPTYHQPPYNNAKKVCTDTCTYRYVFHLCVIVMYRDVPVCTGGTWYPGTAGTRINLDTKILLKNNFAKTKRGNP